MPEKSQRVARVQELMKQEGIHALVCRLPENLVLLTDYWPHHGFSFVVLPQDGKPLLFALDVEASYANLDWAEIQTFSWGLLDSADLYDNYRRFLADVIQRLGLKKANVGIEQSFEVVAPTYRSAEPVVPATPWNNLLAELFAEAQVVDSAGILQQARAVKGEYELQKLKVTNEIAEMGVNEFLTKLQPGMTEAQIGAMVEYKIRADGPGYKGARLVRASAEVGGGAEDSTKNTLLIPSTGYVVREGDLVMLELATVVDGYWSDLTYMTVVGQPNARQREIYNAVLEAQQAAAQKMRHGNAFSDPDTAAREVLEKAGLGKYFVHITGHGVGFRYHEFIPFLAPGAQGVLQAGMVSSVEPGVYIDGFGGIRIEDNVAVGPEGPVFLSTPRKPW